MLVDVPKLITAYYAEVPDPSVPAQRVAFGTSGHRGSSFKLSFNEWHILAITQAICQFRLAKNVTGPLYLGIDTHALSIPACATALEVLAANGVEVMLAEGDEYTPTPVISHAILTYNRERRMGLADGIVITPSHNPPHDGGFKYNPSHGGPADNIVTGWIEAKANEILEARLAGVKRNPHAQALRAATTHRHDYVTAYVNDLGKVVDLDCIRSAQLHLGVDPLGGAGVHYWPRLAEQYRLNLTVVDQTVDPTFQFMTVDWDGQMIDRITAKLGRKLFEVPVGFKWFVEGLRNGSLGFAGEESAGSVFLRLVGTVWTTDKDGFVPCLVAAEMTARMGRDPASIYHELTHEFGAPAYERMDAPATAEQKERLGNLSSENMKLTELAGEPVQAVLTYAPGNHAPIGGLKVATENGWFAARPSGTENIYKVYAESFRGPDHLRLIQAEAQTMIQGVLAPPPAAPPTAAKSLACTIKGRSRQPLRCGEAREIQTETCKPRSKIKKP